MLTNVLLALTVLGICALLWQLRGRSATDTGAERARSEALDAELKKTQAELRDAVSERDEFAGKNKQLFAENTRLQAKNDALQHERDALERKLTKHEAHAEQREKDVQKTIDDMNAAKKSWEDERIRVRREDEERLAREKEEWDRMWNEHEVKVIAQLSEMCSRKEYGFKSYDNANLPEGFDGSLKPDFLIEFGGQYVIFDAKASKSNDLRTYIANTVRLTAAKVKKKSQDIYPVVFFVVPTLAIPSLRQTSFNEQGITFHVISPEAIGPVLAAFKKMSEYEFADKFDPEERENFISLLARLDGHINDRNAYDLIMAKIGAELLQDAHKMHPEIAQEVATKKDVMKRPSPKPTDIKRLAGSLEAQEAEVRELIEPQSRIAKNTVKKVAEEAEIEMRF